VTQIILPSTIKPSGLWKKRGEAFRLKLARKQIWNPNGRIPKLHEHPGRQIGKPAGTYVLDLVERRKAIILCWRCQPHFNHKRANYYKDMRFSHVVGRCDGCREYMNHQTKLYIHESFLGEPGGQTWAGQVWTPL